MSIYLVWPDRLEIQQIIYYFSYFLTHQRWQFWNLFPK